MLSSRGEFSLRIVYVSILIGAKQSHNRKGFKKHRLKTMVEGDNVQTRENIYIYIYFFFFFFFFFFQNL